MAFLKVIKILTNKKTGGLGGRIKTFLPLNDPTVKTKAMPESFILTSTLFTLLSLSLFFKQLDMSCLRIGGVEGNSGIPVIWRVYNRYCTN